MKDGVNWYVYANNNPLRWVDPSGLEIIKEDEDAYYSEETGEWYDTYEDALKDSLNDSDTNLDIGKPPDGPYILIAFNGATDIINVWLLLDTEANTMTMEEIKQYLENRREAAKHHPEDALWSYGWYGGIQYCGGVVGDEYVTHLTFRQDPLDSVDAAYKEHDWGGFIETGKFHTFFSDESLKSDHKLVSDLSKIIESGVVFDIATKKPLPSALNKEALGVASDSLTFFRDILIPYKTKVRAMQSIPETVNRATAEQLFNLYELFRSGGLYY